MAPYMYRILTPLLVYYLPFKHANGFTLINIAALVSTSVLFYYYLKKLSFKPLYSFLGVLIFILAPNVMYNMYNIALVDNLSFLFFLSAFYAILCKNDKLYLFALILGILNKENILFTLPLYFLCKLKGQGIANAFKSTILVSLGPFILYFIIRYYFGFNSYLALNPVIISNNILTNPYIAFGVLWLIALYNVKLNENKFLKNSLFLLPIIFLQIFIATDSMRNFFIAFPIIIPLSLYMFKIKDNRIISIFLILSIFTLLLYLMPLTKTGNISLFISSLFDLYSFLVLPLAVLITFLLIILFIKNEDLKIFKSNGKI
jgi:hypothetical protein